MQMRIISTKNPHHSLLLKIHEKTSKMKTTLFLILLTFLLSFFASENNANFPVSSTLAPSSEKATQLFFDGVEEDDESTLFPFASGPLIFTISLKSMFLEIILHFVNIFINAIPCFPLIYFLRELLFANDKSLFWCFLL
ncbi:hypothetical protein ACFFRR_000626 [Megaselia abdita]